MYPYLHAAIRTPTSRLAAPVCFFTRHTGLHLTLKGSTLACLSRHFLPVSRGQQVFTRLQCSLYATACKFARPTEVTPSAFAKVWDFYCRAFPHSVTLLRVDYNYLGVQTIPRTGLSPAGYAALWAAKECSPDPFVFMSFNKESFILSAVPAPLNTKSI